MRPGVHKGGLRKLGGCDNRMAQALSHRDLRQQADVRVTLAVADEAGQVFQELLV